jgi:hypothetical protein
MEIRIRDDVFLWLSKLSNVRKGRILNKKKIRCVLKRVTGGANGRGEHMRSFTTDEQYTPKARTMSNLIQNFKRESASTLECICLDAPATHFRKNMAGSTVMKNVCVPRDEV